MAFKFIVVFAFLAAVNAGHLTSGYYGYEPTIQKTYGYAAPVAKTIEYAAPVHKTIYEPSPVYAKSVYAPEPYHHAYAPSVYSSHHGTVSHYGKTIATPHSIVNKYDTRLFHEDPHYKVAAYPSAYSASYPSAYSAAYPSAYSAYPSVVKSPVVVKTPVVSTVVKSPIVSSVPVVKSYDHAYDHSYAHAAHAYDHSYAHAAPVIAKTAAVAYSPAVAVSHASFESAHGHYAW